MAPAKALPEARLGSKGSQDGVVLRGLFDRFVLFLQGLANTLGAQGVWATMERASALQAMAEDKQSCYTVLWIVLLLHVASSALEVPLHAYLHLRRRRPPPLCL